MVVKKGLPLALLVGSAMLVINAAPTLAAGWYQTPTPSIVNTQLSVSCWSSSGCMSVGHRAMRWNGTHWSAVEKSAGTVEAVACTAATFCLAVGQNGSQRAAAWKWNGASWKSLAAYNPASSDNILYAVKCASTTSCEAVGSHGYGSNNDTWPLAEHWNGKSWSHQSTTGAPHGALHGVACESSSKCEAVGADFDGTSTRCDINQPVCPVAPIALAMGWSGSAWRSQNTPPQPFMTENNQNGPGDSYWQDTAVSCWSAGCEAVGWQLQAGDPSSVQPEAYSETWNGTAWVLGQYGITCGSNPTCQGNGSLFSAVHCNSASSCTAVGWYYSYDSAETAVAAWNGSQWHAVSSPSPAATNAELWGFVCDVPSLTPVTKMGQA